ncbi:MAG: hypothetical protein K9L26_03735 [Candidatus Izimaplasma sp.]|nr:hypothetical protein [Candidatus Izimaplasma bacterium]
MTFKEHIMQEKIDLHSAKRPYETAAFIIFAIMFIQQMAYWGLQVFRFVKNGWMTLNLPSTPAFVIRIISIDASKWLYVILGFLGLVLWYFIIYLLVFNYCQKKGYAKWVWTTLIAFGPATILFIPTYLIYAVYVFRPYVFRFIRRGVEEYKAFHVAHEFEEEVATETNEVDEKTE